MTIWQFFTKLNIPILYDLAVTLLGVYSNELKTYVYTKPHTQMLTEALFIIAKTWMQSECPSIGKWKNKLWYTQTIAYYSALKRNELSSHKKT